MPGPVPGIHALLFLKKDVDGRDKPGHDASDKDLITMNLSDDPRIVRGMQAQAKMRQRRLGGGDRLIGWKVGFGAPALLERFKISGPLVGFLAQGARVQSGGSVSFAGWSKPVLEPEIAVHIGRDVPAGADRATAAAAIAGISPAIEIVDFDEPPDDPERILGHNIYQRHVVLGAPGPARAGSASDGLTCRIIRRGAESARTTDPQANTGEWITIVQHVANMLAAFGGGLKAGEFIITGSVVPPLTVERDEEGVAFEVDPIGGVSIHFRW
jgi:2-keto-4-pentenoate hydratase